MECEGKVGLPLELHVAVDWVERLILRLILLLNLQISFQLRCELRTMLLGRPSLRDAAAEDNTELEGMRMRELRSSRTFKYRFEQ